jgi:hypothetical protein
VPVAVLQMGSLDEHIVWLPAEHSLHAPLCSHAGLVAGQLASLVHLPQVCVAGSQSGRDRGQSPPALQSTQV